MSNLELIHALEGAVEAAPENLALRKHLASLMMGEGLYAESVAHLRRALDLDPRDGELKYALARAYAGQGKQDVALVVLEDLMRTGSPSPDALIMAAHIYAESEHWNEAKRAYTQARLSAGFTPDSKLEAFLGSAPVENAGKEKPLQQGKQVWVESPQQDAIPDQEGDQENRVPVYLADNGENDGLFEIERPRITFADVGGMDRLKEEIRMKIIYPLAHPELFKAYGKTAGGGILMYGPPGCGKTTVVRRVIEQGRSLRLAGFYTREILEQSR